MLGPRMTVRNRCRILAAASVMLGPPLVVAVQSPPEAKVVGTQAQEDLWQHGLALLGRGKSDEAANLIHRLVVDGVVDRRVRAVDGWLAGFEKSRAERRERIRTDYEKYVAWVKEDMAKGLWDQVVWSCGLAFNTAEDQDAFRQEAWLREAVEGLVKAAAQYETDHEWYKAARIHVRLAEIFPRHKDYEEALERCQDHIRAELLYEKDSEWETAVSNIDPELARNAFARIATEYLKEPDFKKATLGGLQQLLLIARTSKLGDVFEGIRGEDAEEFVIRIEANLTKIKAKEELGVDDLIGPDGYLDKVLTINRDTGLLPETVLIHEFMYGALQPLDKFSDMIWPAEVQEFEKHTQGHFSGVGIQIRKQTGEPILVVSPLKDSPAYCAGIRPGDLITKINGKPANKYSITRAVREITGAVGTTVTLTFKRPGLDKEFDVPLERQEIIIETTKGYERGESGDWKYMIDPAEKIGYVSVTSFTDGTFGELQEVMERLTDEHGLRGLIFDLRDNPGGPLKAAVDVSDLLLGADKKIVSTRDRHGKLWEVPSSAQALYTDFPMIVLVSPYSASASEIVSGALQVHKRALIVGERTYGKGSVQQVLPLNESRTAFLKLTTALYYLPNDRCLHRDEDSTTWGVDPDIEARLVPKERVKLNELHLKRDILKGKNQAALTEEDLKHLTDYRSATRPAVEEEKKTEESPHQGVGDEGEESETPGRGDGDDEEEEEEEEFTRTDPNEYPEIDPQLDEALLLMRVWLETDRPWPSRPAEMAATPVGG